jgi:hypothetical protein
MSRQIINVGSANLAGDGEPLRSALIKVNENFEEVYNNIDAIEIPTDISELTDAQGLLSSGGSTGDITFTNSTLSGISNTEVVVQSVDANEFGTARLRLEPEFSTAELLAYSGEGVDAFTLSNGDFATGVWQDNGFGNGVVLFTGAQPIGDLFQNTLFKLSSSNVTISINGGEPFVWNGGVGGAGTDTVSFGTNPIVPTSPITITSIEFRYRAVSSVSVGYDFQEIRLIAENAGVRIAASGNIQMYGDQSVELQSTAFFSISAGEDINISTSSNYAVRISAGDIDLSAFDDVRIEGRDSFRLINSSATAPIRIITNDDNISRIWAFRPDGRLAFPLAVAPTTSKGAVGDEAGSVAFDSTYIYYCTTTYTDGLADIWKRVAWSADTW